MAEEPRALSEKARLVAQKQRFNIDYLERHPGSREREIVDRAAAMLSKSQIQSLTREQLVGVVSGAASYASYQKVVQEAPPTQPTTTYDPKTGEFSERRTGGGLVTGVKETRLIKQQVRLGAGVPSAMGKTVSIKRAETEADVRENMQKFMSVARGQTRFGPSDGVSVTSGVAQAPTRGFDAGMVPVRELTPEEYQVYRRGVSVEPPPQTQPLPPSPTAQFYPIAEGQVRPPYSREYAQMVANIPPHLEGLANIQALTVPAHLTGLARTQEIMKREETRGVATTDVFSGTFLQEQFRKTAGQEFPKEPIGVLRLKKEAREVISEPIARGLETQAAFAVGTAEGGIELGDFFLSLPKHPERALLPLAVGAAAVATGVGALPVLGIFTAGYAGQKFGEQLFIEKAPIETAAARAAGAGFGFFSGGELFTGGIKGATRATSTLFPTRIGALSRADIVTSEQIGEAALARGAFSVRAITKGGVTAKAKGKLAQLVTEPESFGVTRTWGEVVVNIPVKRVLREPKIEVHKFQLDKISLGAELKVALAETPTEVISQRVGFGAGRVKVGTGLFTTRELSIPTREPITRILPETKITFRKAKTLPAGFEQAGFAKTLFKEATPLFGRRGVIGGATRVFVRPGVKVGQVNVFEIGLGPRVKRPTLASDLFGKVRFAELAPGKPGRLPPIKPEVITPPKPGRIKQPPTPGEVAKAEVRTGRMAQFELGSQKIVRPPLARVEGKVGVAITKAITTQRARMFGGATRGALASTVLLRPSVSQIPKEGLLVAPRLAYQQVVKPTTRVVEAPRVMELFATREKPVTVTTPRPASFTIAGEVAVPVVTPRYFEGLRLSPVTIVARPPVPIIDTGTPPPPPGYTPPPPIPIIVPPFTPGLGLTYLPRLGGPPAKRLPRGKRRRFEYLPDITSIQFGFRGRKPKPLGGLFTGLELRPLPI